MFVEHKEVGEVKELDKYAKTLLRAADLLEKCGWCQHSYGHNGPRCIRGAVISAGEEAGWSYEFGIGAALKRLDMGFGGEAYSSMVWNDAPGRTKEEVVAKLRAVALGL